MEWSNRSSNPTRVSLFSDSGESVDRYRGRSNNDDFDDSDASIPVENRSLAYKLSHAFTSTGTQSAGYSEKDRNIFLSDSERSVAHKVSQAFSSRKSAPARRRMPLNYENLLGSEGETVLSDNDADDSSTCGNDVGASLVSKGNDFGHSRSLFDSPSPIRGTAIRSFSPAKLNITQQKSFDLLDFSDATSSLTTVPTPQATNEIDLINF